MNFKKLLLFAFVTFCFTTLSKAQFTATWAFTANNIGVKAGTQQADIVINNAIIGSAFASPGYSNSNGIKCQPSIDWPTAPTNNWYIDFPISPITGVDATLLGFTFAANTSGTSGNNMVSLAVQADGVGAFVPFGTPQSVASGGSSTVTFPAFNRKLYNGHTYLVRMYMYAASSGTTKSRSLSIKNAVFNGTTATAGTQPTVTTTSATATGKYTATVTGVVTAGTYTIAQSGVVWDAAPNPTINLATLTTSGPTTSGNIDVANGGAISGLSAGATYNTRAYVISESGDVFYGSNLTFTTNPPSIATLTTNVATNITSIKALSGGVIIDSGGVGITAKGVCWNTASNPTISNNITTDGAGNASYSSLLKILNPSTTYYARAYATNSIGTAYGNEISFTTAAPQPVVITTTANGQNSIPFGNVIVNNISAVKSYTLTANNLTPANGSITVKAPIGFEVSTSAGTGYANTITINYTGGTITATTIYGRFLPNQYGLYSDTIRHYGGGADTLINVDNVLVTGTGIQNPSELSNTGMDFWTGYATHNLMYNSDGTSIQSNGGDQTMVLYLSNSNNQATNVEVTIPGLGFTSGILPVPANSVYPYIIPNQIGSQYAQLYQEGKFAKGIHIVSNVPIVVYAHIYGKLVSGASLLLPTNTWGIDYYASSYNQKTESSSSSGSYNYFFVIADEDNTVVEITPTVNTLNGWTQNPSTPYTVTLNKGEIYNVLAAKVGSEDVTGSRIKSLDCNKKIAVFSGSGRTGIQGICNTKLSSDNLFAQVFPNAAWGTKYLTAPTQGTTGENIFRIYVRDASTIVSVNGAPTTATLINNFYYELTSTTPLSIDADKPISVVQYTTSVEGCTNSNGRVSGDPEMIFISPIEQSINNATLFSPSNQQIQSHYINVIVPQAGVGSFTLDGNAVAATKFTIHPQNSNFAYATFDATDGLVTGQHTIKSSEAFTAIAYGFGDANSGGSNPIRESYGYNAGTHLRSLTQYLSVNNTYPNLTNDSVIATCVKNSFNYKVYLPYKPLSMKWDFFNNPAQMPLADTVLVNNPIPQDSVTVNGTKLYKYTLPTTYYFTATGTYPVNITVNATNADGCTGLQTITFNVKVVEAPKANFNVVFNGCPFDFANFSDSSFDHNGDSCKAWVWNFGFAGGISTLKDPTITYPGAGTYNVSLRAIDKLGCYSDTVKPFTIYPGPKITSITNNSVGVGCANTAYIFTTNAIANIGTLHKWYWFFSDGKKDTTTINTVSHTFTTAGTYKLKVYVETDYGCTSNYDSVNLTVYQVKAIANFVTPQCINTPITFTDASTGEQFTSPLNTTWNWTAIGATTTTATTQNAVFSYATAGNYSVKLKTTLTYNGTDFCTDSVPNSIVINPVLAKPTVTVDATATTTSSLTFNWNAITGATGYEVTTNNGATWQTPSSGAMGTTHVLTGLNYNTNYTLCVRAKGICGGDSACATATTTKPSTQVYIPNMFTPNNSGKNDKMIICSNNITNIRFMVFNQYGEKMYEVTNPNATALDCFELWDGKAFGKDQPVGVYVYVASYTLKDSGKNEVQRGTINLIR